MHFRGNQHTTMDALESNSTYERKLMNTIFPVHQLMNGILGRLNG